MHVLQRDEVLRTRDRARRAANIAAQGNTHDQRLAHRALTRQVPENRLHDAVTQHRRCYVRNPHTGETCYKHGCYEDGPWSRSGLGEDEGRHHLSDIVFRERSGDGEATEKEHDDWSPHRGEDVRGSSFRGEASIGALVGADDTENNGEKGNEKRGNEEGNGLAFGRRLC